MDLGWGILWFIGFIVILFLISRAMEKNYYKRKHDILDKKKARLKERKNNGQSPKDKK